MPKINQEEYEVLKELDDKWKWIARDEDKTLWVYTEILVRKSESNVPYYWDTETEKLRSTLELIDEIHLFQFIQWEDESPYNIIELIEEYERESHIKQVLEFYEEGFRNVREAFIKLSKAFSEESEETEVKNIEWLKENIGELPIADTIFVSGGKQYVDTAVPVMGVYDLINQLDEPEVLSQEFINEKAVEVYADIADAEVHAVFRMRDLQKLLVPKQELPVIPEFVADYIDDRKEVGFPIYQAIRIVRENSRFEHGHLREWLWTNKGQEIFVRAWLDGYEVAEEREQRYYVDLESAAYVAKWEGNGQVDIYTDGISGSDEYELHLTELEIKDYDERFWPFAVNVEELEE